MPWGLGKGSRLGQGRLDSREPQGLACPAAPVTLCFAACAWVVGQPILSLTPASTKAAPL